MKFIKKLKKIGVESNMIKVVKKIVKDLLDIEVVFLNFNELFIWVSGIKSLIYCDNCIMMSYFVVCKEIVEGLVVKIKEIFLEVEVIVGIVIVGILYVVWVVDILGLLMVYICSKVKDYGKGN